MPLYTNYPADAASQTYIRLVPRLTEKFKEYQSARPEDWAKFSEQLSENFEQLFSALVQIYGGHFDFYFHLEALLETLANAWIERPAELKGLDQERQKEPLWYQSNRMIGGVCYVDLYARNLKGLKSRLPYFKELGLTYIHLMPFFRRPKGENDGGYAISSYREVDSSLGSMDELSALAADMRGMGISLVVDFVFNHTSDEHIWAQKAYAGEKEFQNFYYMFPDRELPDAYERTLREIFPEEHSGSFTWCPKIQKWVWTTFNSYQWDLNYSNPAVFNAMAREMLALANIGAEVLRLDALAFIWKEMGTSCENLPEAHVLIQAFNACARISAPALLLKSEAIVHPAEVAKYIDPHECQVSYNPLLMALLWESLATRNVSLLAASMRDRFGIAPECSWINYVRCHDDIGWTFSDEDAGSLGINGYDHRRFLNSFYTGRFEGSFARGLPFQENLKTGDCRISGSTASLAGLEYALLESSPLELDLAVGRILLIHAVIMLIGGIPLIYLGDELATLNDYSYRDKPSRMDDSRWVHRSKFNRKRAAERMKEGSPVFRVYSGLSLLINLRKNNEAFGGHETEFLDTGNASVFGFLRTHENQRVLLLANFSEHRQAVSANLLRLYGPGYQFVNLVTGESVPPVDFDLKPYQFLCLQAL